MNPPLPTYTPFSENESQSDILLVAMPFGPLFQPSIGLTLLKGSLAQQGFASQILYLTVRFAEFIGDQLYVDIATGNPYVDLAGEWLFSRAVHEIEDMHFHQYVDDVLLRNSPENTRMQKVPQDYIDDLYKAHELVEPFLDGALDEILSYKPRIIGFTSTFQQHVATLAIAQRIKAVSPETFIVLGGGNCEGSMGYETIRQYPFIDAVVSGEGEIIFPTLIEKVLANESINTLQGVFTRNNYEFMNVNGNFLSAPSVRDMDALPIPDYDDYIAQLAHSQLDQREPSRILFETSRGCWWGERQHCTFCGLNGETMAYRSKSGDRAVQELITLVEKYPKYPVWVVDNILDMKYFNDFVPSLQAMDLDLELFYEVKANLRKEQLIAMREAGIRYLQPGIESLNSHVLKLMKKGVSALQNIQLLKWGKELGIEIFWNILWGFPGETFEDYDEMRKMLPALYHLKPPTGSALIRLDRFSPNFNQAEDYGFINVRPALPYNYIYPHSRKALQNLAYHFSYDYAEPRDVRSYTQPLAVRINEWRDAYANSVHLFVDLQSHLILLDLRPDAVEPVAVLTDIQRELYLVCHQITSARQLSKLLDELTPEDISLDEIMEPLIDANFVLQDGNAYLNLAVPLGSHPLTVNQLIGIKNIVAESRLFKVMDHDLPRGTSRSDLPAYFGVNEFGEVFMYYAAFEYLLSKLLHKNIVKQPARSIAGITVDM